MERAQFMNFLGRHFFKWLWKVVVLVLLLAAVRSSIADWSEVPTRSMVPAILPGDRIYVNKLADVDGNVLREMVQRAWRTKRGADC